MRTNHLNSTSRTACMLGTLTVFSTLLLISCQKENTKPESAPVLKTVIDCGSNCIEPGGPYFEQTDSKTVVYGGGPNQQTKIIDIIYYNTETDFVVKVKSNKGWNDLLVNNIDVYNGSPVAANVWGTYSYPLDAGWEACDLEAFALKVTGQGPPVTFNVSYNLIGICDDGCETEFSGEALSCGNQREATYTFRADELKDYIKIQGGLTNFTGADAVVEVSGGNLTVSQWTPGGSTNRVIKVEGSVDECEEITIHITWNSTNSGGIITGNWSVKDSDGVDIAPELEGLFCQ